MTLHSLPDDQVPEASPAAAATVSAPEASALPRITLLTMFRLGLFQMGLGMLSLLTLGVLNRVMIDELAIPAVITGLTLAMYQFVAPARVWFGQLSDSRPLFGLHRTGYLLIGSGLFTLCLFLGVQVIWQMAGSLAETGFSLSTWGWMLLGALAFAVYGLCVGSSSTPFAALLVDVSDEDNRSKLVGIVWSMLMVGIVVGAILSSQLLEGVTPETLQGSIDRLFLIVPGIVFLVAWVATFGVERKYSRFSARSSSSGREDQITLKGALQVLTASRQTGIFFTFLVMMTLGLFVQQPVLEPYGGEVFGMTLAETTQLNAVWGTGILIGIPATGFLLVPRVGKMQATRLGCLGVAISFMLTILVGFSGEATWLRLGLFLFGLASGVTTNGAVSLMLDLTAAETAGTFIGAWGLAQALSQALATVIGGAVLDLGKAIFPSTLLAYAGVFGLEALAMVAAVVLLGRVDVEEFRADTGKQITSVLATELD